MDDASTQNKLYAVVKFISDSTYSEIPTTWLVIKDNKQLCWWPPRTANAATLIANCTHPNIESWYQYEVQIIKHCSYLESARKSAADANYHTTDEDTLGRGKRVHIANSRYSSDEESEKSVHRTSKKKVCSTIVSAVPSCPENFSLYYNIDSNENAIASGSNGKHDNISSSKPHYDTSKTSSIETDKTRLLNIHDMPVVFHDYAPLTEINVECNKEEEAVNIKSYLKQIVRMLASSQLMLQDLKERVKRLEDAIKSHGLPVMNTSDTLIAQLLPLNTIDKIQEFESLIKNVEEAVVQFKQFLLKTGGNNPKDNIHRALTKTFTNDCAILCSWKGIRNNFKVSSLYFMKLMRREMTAQHANLTETQFDNTVADWLRFAKQRKQREEKGKENEEPLH